MLFLLLSGLHRAGLDIEMCAIWGCFKPGLALQASLSRPSHCLLVAGFLLTVNGAVQRLLRSQAQSDAPSMYCSTCVAAARPFWDLFM